jgi:uncharacterized protein HemX
MSVQEWAGLTLTILSIVALVAGAVKWYIGQQISPIKEAVDDIRSETKTNGGSSMRDEIRSIKKQQEEAKELRKQTNKKLDHMYEVLLDYIAKSK